jgi:hypothetical protein
MRSVNAIAAVCSARRRLRFGATAAELAATTPVFPPNETPPDEMECSLQNSSYPFQCMYVVENVCTLQ